MPAAAPGRVEACGCSEHGSGRPGIIVPVSGPQFSVVIPTRDRPRLLGEAVASVLSQTVDNWECLVVDDAGAVPVETFGDERVRVLRQETNGGVARARNTGMEQARGDHLVFLDDDDRWLPGRLELAERALRRAPVAVCFRVGSDGTTGGNRLLEGDVADVILDALTPQLGQVAVRRERAPPFDPRFRGSQDVDWWLRLAQDCRVATEPEVGLWYRKHKGERKGNSRSARVDGGLALLDKHADYFAGHPRAHAFRWKRIAIMAGREGDRRLALRALRRSFALKPDPALGAHLVRLALPRC